MPEPLTRARLFEGALLAGGGIAVGGVVISSLPDDAASQPSQRQDAEILNFGLLLEYVQAGFYEDAIARGGLDGELRAFAERVGSHERRHVAFIRDALGRRARKRPQLDFGEDTATPESFTQAALALEDLGVAAYNTQAPNLTNDALAAAARIVSVEARHAAWIRDIAGKNPAPDASEPQVSPDRVVEQLNRTGYIQ